MARLRTPIGGTRSGILLVMQPDAFSRSCSARVTASGTKWAIASPHCGLGVSVSLSGRVRSSDGRAVVGVVMLVERGGVRTSHALSGWWWNAYAAIARGRLPPWMSGKVMSPPAISLTNAGVLSAANQRLNKSLILSEGMKSLIG